MSEMSDQIDITGELSSARSFIELAFRACHELPKTDRDAFAAVLDEASQKIGRAIDAIDAQDAQKARALAS